jgi:hypothetical protein
MLESRILDWESWARCIVLASHRRVVFLGNLWEELSNAIDIGFG